ncbi:uncharacterized protein LOC119075473 [Bradysia coprophila]|uniref:uncharacterized protein LOC119075473 n=1 Tax=Bradysia coprophila TaxID=38358 RepID=UPI00187DB748|nr:uncharacterized protein LOC119075473 [Bradysia coprophila]XP_037037818.1 uncharacterized protein LOC119075473 [Bradysia coprophila]
MLDIDFDRPGTFYPGDTFTCTVDVQSWFKINCKYVKVRLRCPYRKSEVEVFRVYEIANQRIDTGEDESDYRIGGKAENIVLQRGRNRFIVSCKIPDVPDETFKKYSNVIRCSFKVTVNANWLPKRCCLDWFVLAPRTVAEEIFDKIEDSGHKVFSSIRSRIRGVFAKKNRAT